jgi:para-nitrobenzyl esterase
MIRKTAWLFLVFALAGNAAIMTENGPVQGFIAAPGVNAWLGIPYAAPPVGNLRWMPPQPYGNFPGVFQANNFGNPCTQPNTVGGAYGSEDCLTLNVFSPAQISQTNQSAFMGLPVMVWIHGGSFVTGMSSYFDPSPMVTKGNVIVVTMNYRLGLLGFFAHPAIDGEGHVSGNYGLMDQQFALRWVQRNIAAFGGDPYRITIFGESAGGESVYTDLASPTASGAFHRAIVESGAYDQFQDYYNLIVPLATAEMDGTASVPAGTSTAAAVGCASQSAQCLRGIPATTLVLAESPVLFPFVDGITLVETPAAAFASGQFNHVPVISGGNHDEYRLSVKAPASPTDYQNAVLAAVGPVLAPAMGFRYPLANYSSPVVALATLGTDGYFACPERNSVRSLAQYVTTWAYEFNDEQAPTLLVPPASFPMGAYHTAELQYLFNMNVRFAGVNPFTPAQQQLSDTMIGYWTQFATTGDPNFAGAPVWAPYSAASDQFQSLVPPAPAPESGFDADHKCSSLWNTF